METVFSKVGTLIEHSVRRDSNDGIIHFPDITNGIHYVVKFNDTEDKIEFVSHKKILFGDKVEIKVFEDELGEYFCTHIFTDKFGMHSVNLVGNGEDNEITFNDLKVDTKDFIRELSDYENRFNLEIKIV